MVRLDEHLREARRRQKRSNLLSTAAEYLAKLPGATVRTAKGIAGTGSQFYRSTLPSQKFLARATPTGQVAERIGFFAPLGVAGYLGYNAVRQKLPSSRTEMYEVPTEMAGTYFQTNRALRHGQLPPTFT